MSQTTTLNPYELAALTSEITSPDSQTSPGAKFLESIQDSVNDYLQHAEDEDIQDMIHEIADGAVPIYTHELFQVLVDLAAYAVDISDLGEPKDIEQAAQWALYSVARDTAAALLADDE